MLISNNIGSGKSTIVVRNDDIFSDGSSHPPEEVEVVVRMATDNNIPQCTTETNPISAPATTSTLNGRTTLLTTTGMVIPHYKIINKRGVRLIRRHFVSNNNKLLNCIFLIFCYL